MMSYSNYMLDQCPICLHRPVDIHERLKLAEVRVTCPSCGGFTMDEDLAQDMTHHFGLYGGKRFLLSAIVRRRQEDGGRLLHVRREMIPMMLDSVALPETPFEQIDHVLHYVQRLSTGLDSFVKISDLDYPIAVAHDRQEFGYLLGLAVQCGLLENPGEGNYRLTLSAWRRLQELKETTIQSNQAFVAMSFHPEMNSVWHEGIKPALEHTGYRPIRLDEMEHNEKICDRIIAEIRRSGLLVADFTDQRGGVYFEAGFGMGLGIPVIWTCRNDEIENLHFDTRQYNYIPWTDYNDLRVKLINRIEATVPRYGWRT